MSNLCNYLEDGQKLLADNRFVANLSIIEIGEGRNHAKLVVSSLEYEFTMNQITWDGCIILILRSEGACMGVTVKKEKSVGI